MYKENICQLKIKKKHKEKLKDKSVVISGEVYQVLNMYSTDCDIPIKMLVDTLLKFSLEHIEIVCED